MKKLLSIDELIEHMKQKGITFKEVSESDAKEFLQKNNYYMKLASYRKNYPKYQTGKKEGKNFFWRFGISGRFLFSII